MTGGRLLVLTCLAAGGSGCAGMQSTLDPAGPAAGPIASLWWVLLGICVVVQLLVTAAVAVAIGRRHRQDVASLLAHGEPTKRRVVMAATGVTLLVLVVLVSYSVVVDRAVARLPPPDVVPLVVNVTGHMWWWEVEYEDDTSSRRFTTANELRVPVGRPVVVNLEARDVIHSFWVPNLAGKLDVMPGRRNTLWFQADRPGTFRGQCAEFCGLQHAKMAFLVVAEAPDEFEAWAEAYRQTPAPPGTPLAARGEQVFLSSQCALCHRVRGTQAWGLVAPDLSRIGSRRTLAAGTLPNTPENMAAWIRDPQGIKPGTFMPATRLDDDSLDALVAYLDGLR